MYAECVCITDVFEGGGVYGSCMCIMCVNMVGVCMVSVCVWQMCVGCMCPWRVHVYGVCVFVW